MLRLTILVLISATFGLSFSPMNNIRVHSSVSSPTELQVTRRDVMVTTACGILTGLNVPNRAFAFSQQLDDNVVEPSQQATGGKLDLNSAFIGDYKQLRGMYPHAAGKIASNGPYTKVSDIYNIKGLTANDKKVFQKYENMFTVNPPGRAFKERINARVST